MSYDFSFCKDCRYPSCVDCVHIRALAMAEQQGRLVIKRKPITATCGTCVHFHPEPNRSSGPCEGRLNLRGYRFSVCQSRKACGSYKNREELEDEK